MRTNNTTRQLLLNVSPITFDDATISAGVFELEDNNQLSENIKQKLKTLRGHYYRSHVFRREKNRILCVPYVNEAPDVGDSKVNVTLSDNLYLSAALVRNALINFLHGLGRQVLDFSPVRFVADRQADLLSAAIPSDLLASPQWLFVRPSYEFDIRVITFDREQPFIGAVLNVRTARFITKTCSELINDSFPIGGCYVGMRLPSDDERVEPRLRMLGRVLNVKDNLLMVDDVRSDFDEIVGNPAQTDSNEGKFVDANRVMLMRSPDSFARCLSHAFDTRASEVGERLQEKLIEFRSGRSRLANLKKAIGYFRSRPLEMLARITFSMGPFFAEGESKMFSQVQTAPRPIFVFDPTERHTDSWHDRGLSLHGPYDAASHTPTTPKVCVICQTSVKGRVEEFLAKFLHGIPEQAKPGGYKQNNPMKFDRFATGLIGKYKLDNVALKFFTADNDRVEAYQKAVREALAYQRDNSMKWDLALVQIEDRFHNLFGDRNPYFVTKAAFLAHQIASQEFKLETVAMRDRQLTYVLNNMALATYTKLGGIPWLMKANRTIAHELVFGLGSASIGEGRLGTRERIVGITTVFSGEGKYHLSNLSQAVPMSDYKEALFNSLRNTINKVREELNWQRRDHVRLVFHSFSPFKNVDVADVVQDVVCQLEDYNVDLAFLHVVDEHPFMLFDEAEPGVKDYETGGIKGALAPERGYFFRLSNYEVIMSLTGPKELKRPEDGMPHPIILRLHRHSTFGDTTYLARQVYAFSCHSWRSFFPSPMPVTILYSQLIARILGNLASVTNWDPDALLDQIGTTRWFL